MTRSVLVVEDDNLTRITLTTSLQSAGMESVLAASSVAEAVELAAHYIPDSALIDLHLGSGPTGLDLARRLRSMNPHIGIVILTSYDDPRLLGENPDFIPAGTRYLTKRAITDIGAITEALSTSQKSTRLVPRSSNQLHGVKLSENQLAILKLIAEGFSNSEIARRRGVSEKAIEGSISRLATKLSVEKDSALNQRVHIARVYFRALGLKLDDDVTES